MLPNLDSKTFRWDFRNNLGQLPHFMDVETEARRGLAETWDVNTGQYNIICNNFAKDLVIIYHCGFQNVVLGLAALA